MFSSYTCKLFHYLIHEIFEYVSDYCFGYIPKVFLTWISLSFVSKIVYDLIFDFFFN